MLFNSLQFALFFPLVTALFFALAPRQRQWLLLVASSVFYAAFVPAYLLIILALIATDYWAAILIDRADGRRRRGWLLLSIVANVGMLAWFKYLNFILANAAAGYGLMSGHLPASWHLDIVLPIGLSFHTFQSMAYTIEVYRRRAPVERDPVTYALYVLFYPQLVAGPIERPQHLIPQLALTAPFDYARITSGLKLMAWGLFKKMVVADRLAAFVAPAYNDPHHFPGPALAFATVAFALQIYGDFSGYSDVAIGAAEVMGVRLVRNFDRPYASRTVAEFWQRWHISLSSWFRDYVYIPLGGNRLGAGRRYLNLMVTFLLSGLWHGASWTYVAWGAVNGLYLVGAIMTAPLRAMIRDAAGLARSPRLATAWAVTATFVLTCLAWVFFRASTIHDAAYILRHVATDTDGWRALAATPFREWLRITFPGLHLRDLAIAGGAVIVMEAVQALQRRGSVRERVARAPLVVRWSLYYAICLAIVAFRPHVAQQFIYFQF